MRERERERYKYLGYRRVTRISDGTLLQLCLRMYALNKHRISHTGSVESFVTRYTVCNSQSNAPIVCHGN